MSRSYSNQGNRDLWDFYRDFGLEPGIDVFPDQLISLEDELVHNSYSVGLEFGIGKEWNNSGWDYPPITKRSTRSGLIKRLLSILPSSA